MDVEELEAAIRPDTVVCSVLAVNNEIGVVQPLKEIGEICRKNKVFFHSDIAQMLGKVSMTEALMEVGAGGGGRMLRSQGAEKSQQQISRNGSIRPS